MQTAHAARPAHSLEHILRNPQQGDVIEYWWVQTNAKRPQLSHFQVTYYEHLKWAEHARQSEREVSGTGRDFHQEWTVEQEGPEGWHFNGCSATDWVRWRLNDEQVFVYKEQAKVYLRQALLERVAHHHQEAALAQAQISDFL